MRHKNNSNAYVNGTIKELMFSKNNFISLESLFMTEVSPLSLLGKVCTWATQPGKAVFAPQQMDIICQSRESD